MKHISQRQGGMTGLGIFLILVILACFVIFGLRLFPLYNEHLGVKSAMESIINQPPAKRKTIKQIRRLFLRAANVNSLYYFSDRNVKDHVNIKKSKDGKTKYLHVKFQNSNNLFKNIFLMVDTDETMVLSGGKSK